MKQSNVIQSISYWRGRYMQAAAKLYHLNEINSSKVLMKMQIKNQMDFLYAEKRYKECDKSDYLCLVEHKIRYQKIAMNVEELIKGV